MFLWIFAAIVIAALGAFLWIRHRRAAEENDRPIRAVVLFLDRPRMPDVPKLRAMVEKAWNVKLPPEGDENATEFVVGRPDLPSAIVNVGGITFLVNYFPVMYMDTEKAEKEVVEVRTRSIIHKHKAWMSVDLLGDLPEGVSDQHLYSMLGKLAAEMAGNETLGFYLPEFGQLHPYTAETLKALQSGDVVKSLEDETVEPVISIDPDDPRMKAAVEEARTRLPEFINRFESRKSDELFSIKAPITSGDNTEFIWIMVTAMEGEKVYGTLGNDPADLPGYVFGQQVTVRLDTLADWIIKTDDNLEGGFSIKVLTEAAKGE